MNLNIKQYVGLFVDKTKKKKKKMPPTALVVKICREENHKYFKSENESLES